jgi:hypothetical protein
MRATPGDLLVAIALVIVGGMGVLAIVHNIPQANLPVVTGVVGGILGWIAHGAVPPEGPAT